MKYKINHKYGSGNRKSDIINTDERFKDKRSVKNSSDPRINIYKVFKKKNRAKTINSLTTKANKIVDNIKIGFCVVLVAGAIHAGYIEANNNTENQTPSQDEMPPSISENVVSFESKEIPANYMEPDLYDQYFGNKADEARKIATCESGQVATKRNLNHNTKDDSWGLFQINLYGNLKNSRPSSDWLVIPENNIQYAKMLYDNSGGWSKHWVNCSRKLNLK